MRSLVLTCLQRFNTPYLPACKYTDTYSRLQQESPGASKTSKVHYLLPASNVKAPLCAAAASALINRYPIPTIVGYKGEGEYDAHKAHIAKLRVISRYLHQFKKEEEDDLVLIVDGFDVLAQAPAEHMIEQYFKLMQQADQKLADSYSITVDEAHNRGLRQTILWGTDKGCFPMRMDEPQCWLIPNSDLPRYVFGPQTGRGDLPFSDSKFLNSGTVIGPLGDLRDLMDGVLQFIGDTWDKDDKYHNSDQLYISKTYARQEYHRLLNRTDGQFSDPEGRKLPDEKKYTSRRTEYHITVDFDSTFTQTQCHNEPFIHKLHYDKLENQALVEMDLFEEGKTFRSYNVRLPSSFYLSMLRLWNEIPEDDIDKSELSAQEWFRTLRIGTNVATKKQYAFYHNTCSKEHFVDRHRDCWYFNYIKPLLRTAIKAHKANENINSRPIDGRNWKPAQEYPEDSTNDEFGGVFTDHETEEFIPYSEFCKDSLSEVLG